MKDWMDNNQEFNERNVICCLSAPQTSRTGHVLNKILYGMSKGYDDLWEMAPGATGCPHNGGEHTLTLRGTRQDINSWLDLVVEEFPDWEGCASFVKGLIRKRFLAADWRKYGTINVRLRNEQVQIFDKEQSRSRDQWWFQSHWENTPRKEWKPSRREQAIMDKNDPAANRK